MHRLRRRGAKFFVTLVAVSSLVVGVAGAHTIPVPAPYGPDNTYYAEDGAFGVFCAVAHVNIWHNTSYEGVAYTISKYSPSDLCSAALSLDQGLLYAAATVYRPNGAVCD